MPSEPELGVKSSKTNDTVRNDIARNESADGSADGSIHTVLNTSSIVAQMRNNANMRRRVSAAYIASGGTTPIPSDHLEWNDDLYRELSRFLLLMIVENIIRSGEAARETNSEALPHRVMRNNRDTRGTDVNDSDDSDDSDDSTDDSIDDPNDDSDDWFTDSDIFDPDYDDGYDDNVDSDSDSNDDLPRSN